MKIDHHLICIIFALLFSCAVASLVMKEGYKCKNTKLKLKLVLPIKYDPLESIPAAVKRSYLFGLNNKEFADLLGVENKFSLSHADFATIRSERVRKELKEKVDRAFMSQYQILLQSGYQYRDSILDVCSTDNEKIIYIEQYIIMHVPSSAYGKVIKTRAVIDIVDNKVTQLGVSLNGNIAATDIQK